MIRGLLLAGLVSAGCSGSFEPYSLVAGLRLLGAQAEPPQAAPSEMVMLRALAVAPGGPSMTSITVDWAACVEPSIPGSGTINPDCITMDSAPYLIPWGQGAEVTGTVPDVAAATLGDPDVTGGRYLPVRIRVHDASSAVDGVYSLRFADGAARNHNPTLSGLSWVTEAGPVPLDEAAPPTVHAGDRIVLRATVTDDSTETYAVPSSDGTARTATEQIAVAWFSSAGSWGADSVGAGVDDALTLDHPLPQSGTTIDLYAVARDERGGSDFMHRVLLFR